MTVARNPKDVDTKATDVVVVGMGFAGALAVATLLEEGRSVTVVDPTGTHQFLTRLAAVAGGTQPDTDRAVAVGEMFDVPVVTERAVAVNEHTLTLQSGRTLESRYVLLTAGAEPVDPPIDGLRHALPLRSADDSMAIRARLDDAERIVIVGGGPTGCQLAGAISLAHPNIDVSLVDGSDRLMSNFGERLGARAHEILVGRGVNIILEDEADSIAPDGATLQSGRELDGTVVWTAGFQAEMDAFGPTDDGRLIVDQHGRVEGTETVFAAGDAAAHRDGKGEAFAMSAQIAAQAGKQIGKNLSSLLGGGTAKPLDLRDRGWVVDLSGGVGVAEVLGIELAHPLVSRLVPLLHEGIDLRNLWQLGGVDFVRRFRPGAEKL